MNTIWKSPLLSSLLNFMLVFIIIPDKLSWECFITIAIILFLTIIGVLSSFIKKQGKICKIPTKKKLNLVYIFEFLFLVILLVMGKLVYEITGAKEVRIIYVYVILFIYLSKDILFRGIGFCITKMSYDNMPATKFKLILSNFFYCAIVWIGLLKHMVFGNKDSLFFTTVISLFILVLVFDQVYLFLVGKNQSFVNKLLGLKIYDYEKEEK